MKTFREKYLDKNLELDSIKLPYEYIKRGWRYTKNSVRWTKYIIVSKDINNITKYFSSGELIFILDSLDKIFSTNLKPYTQYQFKAKLKGTKRHFWFIATKHCLIKYILNDEQKLLFEIGEL